MADQLAEAGACDSKERSEVAYILL